MTFGIMQPYFFPYLGYYALIKYSDQFIFFDTPQYISHGWINRNRVLKQDGTWNYIVVPIQKASRETAIKDIVISDTVRWKEKIYGQLSIYRKKAPNYRETMDIVRSVLERDYEGNLCKLNMESIGTICDFLEIKKDFYIFSQMDLEIEKVNAPDEWALNITKALHGDAYVNPPGGMSFFSNEKYKRNNINLKFLKVNLKPYVQRIGHFEAGLSIIDVMMFNAQKEIKDMLNDFVLIEGDDV